MKKIVRLCTFLTMIFCLAACGKSVEAQIAEQLELGQKYLAELNYEEAIVAFNKVIELDAKSIPAYTGLGQVYEAQAEAAAEAKDQDAAVKLYELAAEMYEKIQEIDASNDESYEHLVVIYTKIGDLDRLGNLIEKYQGTEDTEDLKSSIEVIEEIKELLMAEEFDSVHELLVSDRFLLFREMILSDNTLIIELEDGKGLGFYPVGERHMVYYGDYVDGKREGQGIWIRATENTYYCVGEWKNDIPNGYQERTTNYYVLAGQVINGLWDGPVVYTVRRDGTEMYGSLVNGKWNIIRELDEDELEDFDGAEKVGEVAMGDNGETMFIEDPDEIEAVVGFDPNW